MEKFLDFLLCRNLSNHQAASRRIGLFTALVLIVIFMGCMGWFPNNALSILSPLNGTVMWFALICVVFCFINLFNKEKVPGEVEFSRPAYFNLLFTLGMGVGIMVYGFNEAASLSGYFDVCSPIGLTLNHWIVIPWCFYVTFAIFEIYDLKYQLLPSWLRVIKTYLYGLMMMLGIGTSFALGVITISGAIEILYGVVIPSYVLVIILGSLVTYSLLRGLHKGMKMMAKYSMYLLYIFMAVMLFILPKGSLEVGLKSIGSFFTDFLYNNIYTGRAVQNDWTVYYWIWWISWAAFTAPFIATISKGRSIRSIVVYTVILPSILITAYMVICNLIGTDLYAQGVELSMLPYAAIGKLPLVPILFIVLMGMFYITSSDSQSFALDNLISKGSKTPVVYRKIGWVLLEVLFVAVLLLAGSGTTSALQGLSFLFTPLMIALAVIYIILIVKHHFKNIKINR